MAPSRRKGSGRAAAAAAAILAQRQLNVGDLVLAKMKGFPAWPAEITEPEKWGFSAVRKKLLVFFYGTKQIAFCNYADIEPFTEERKKSLLLKRQGKGTDFVRAVDEIIEVYDNMKKQSIEVVNSEEQVTEMKLEKSVSAKCDSSRKSPEPSSVNGNYMSKEENDLKENNGISNLEYDSVTSTEIDPQNKELIYKEPVEKISILEQLRHDTITTCTSSSKRKLRNNTISNLEDDSGTPTEIGPQNKKLKYKEPVEKISILEQLRHDTITMGTSSRKRRSRENPISNLEDDFGTSTEIDHQNKKLKYKGRFEKISILEQLRHDTITMGNSSRKRKSRENSYQSSQKIFASLQRSTCLSSTDAVDQMDSALDESRHKQIERRDAGGMSSIGPLNNIMADHGDEITGRNCEPTKVNKEEKLSPSCEQEVLTNGFVDDSVKFSGKLELPKEGLVFKKKRKPIRKRMNNAAECAAVNKEADSQVGQTNTVLESLNPENMTCEMAIKSDGDEHLPLVKRARIRKGKTLGDEAEPSSPVGIDKKPEIAMIVDNINLPCKTSCGENDCPTNGTSLAYKEEINTTENNSSLSSPTDISFWKAAKKYQMKGFDLDVEAALPPSKRLHRAFEAMSANAAETKEYCAETLKTTEANGFKCSPKQSSPKISSEEKVGFAAESIPTSQSFITDEPEVIPQLNKPALPSSEAKSNCNPQVLVNEKSSEILVSAAANFNELPVSDASVDDFQKTSLQSCSSDLAKEVIDTSSKCLTDNLCSSDLANKKERSSLLVEENIDEEIVKPILDRSDSDEQSSPTISSEERVGFAAESIPTSQSSGLITDEAEVIPELNKPALPSSEAKSICNPQVLVNQKSSEILASAAANFNELPVSDASVDDFQKTSLQSCSSDLAKEVIDTSSKCLTGNLCSSDLANKKECSSHLVELNNDEEIVKPILDRSDSDLKPALNRSYSDLKPALNRSDSDMKPALNRSDSDSKPSLKVNIDDNVIPPDEAVTRVSAADASTLGFNKTTCFSFDEDSQNHEMQNTSREAIQRLTPTDKCYSPELTPMKELIAAAQAKRFLSRSASLSDNHIKRAALSPSTVHKEDPFSRFSPPVIISHKYATDDRALPLQNNGRSPQVGHLPKDYRSSSRVENAARKAFEAFLCTLSRTKDSIGRATRLAIDCAKFGIAGEVIDIIVHNLERETTLHRRVDLFFLVDSITQCSRNQKGGAGDVYCSLVQAALPRLLSSAAPRGSAAYENRRQCLKVLRLWLERKTLPESIIRHHIRELDMLNETTFPGGSSRRPLRTERAFNDPVRDMEGMLVDEYGSNTSMQLPDLLGTNVLEVEEDTSSEEKSFEAVTPERPNDLDQEMEEVQMPSSKHRHVLEDIDGELEMEDVAPHEVVVGSSRHLSDDDSLFNTRNQTNEQQLSSFTPPLPEDRPPSPPPLPASPPPFAPLPSTSQSAMPHQRQAADAVSDSSNLHFSVSNNNTHVRQPEPVCQQPCLVSSDSMPYYAPGYAGPKLMPPPVSACAPGSYGSFPGSHLDLHSRDNCPPIVSSSLNSKPYYLPPPPPPPTVSNQFSYIHAEAQRGQPWHNSTYQDRSSYMPDNPRGNFYSDRGTGGGPFHHEVSDGSRFPSAIHSGPLHSEKLEGPSASLRQYGPPSELPPIPCNGWSVPPRLSNYSGFTSRPPAVESPTPRAAGAPGYWRPRPR